MCILYNKVCGRARGAFILSLHYRNFNFNYRILRAVMHMAKKKDSFFFIFHFLESFGIFGYLCLFMK